MRRLRDGDRCLGAWRGDRLVGSRWLAIGEAQVSYLGVRFSIAPRPVTSTRLSRRPHRHLGIGDLLDAAARAEAVSIGKTKVLSGLLPENRVGAAFIAPWGRQLGMLVSIRIGRRRITRSSVPSRYIGPVRSVQGNGCSPSAL